MNNDICKDETVEESSSEQYFEAFNGNEQKKSEAPSSLEPEVFIKEERLVYKDKFSKKINIEVTQVEVKSEANETPFLSQPSEELDDEQAEVPIEMTEKKTEKDCLNDDIPDVTDYTEYNDVKSEKEVVTEVQESGNEDDGIFASIEKKVEHGSGCTTDQSVEGSKNEDFEAVNQNNQDMQDAMESNPVFAMEEMNLQKSKNASVEMKINENQQLYDGNLDQSDDVLTSPSNPSIVPDNTEVENESKTTAKPSISSTVADKTEVKIDVIIFLYLNENSLNQEPTDENLKDDNVKEFINVDEDDDSFFSIEMTTDEIEEPTEGDFGENNDCSKDESMEEFCNNDGKYGDIFPSIINDMIDTVANMEIKQGIK